MLTAVGLVVVVLVSSFVMQSWVDLYARDYGGFGVVLAIYFWIAFGFSRDRRGCEPFTGPRGTAESPGGPRGINQTHVRLKTTSSHPRLEGPVSFDCAAGVAGGAPAVLRLSASMSKEGEAGPPPPWLRRSCLMPVGRAGDVVDLPDIAAQRDHVRGRPDDLQRGRAVEFAGDNGEAAVVVDAKELAGVRICRRPWVASTVGALCEAEHRLPAPPLHVHDQRRRPGDVGDGAPLRVDGDDLSDLGSADDRSRLGHEDPVSLHGEAGRDDVAETLQLRDRSVEADAEHAVVMPVGDEKPASPRLHRVLHPRL